MRPSTAILLSMTPALFTLGACKESENHKADRPNILLVINDDQSFAHTGAAGCPFVHTPGFDRVAADGIYFNNCISGSPGSAPARSSLVTGRYPWQNEQSGQHGSSWMKKHVPFVDLLAANGYHTGYTGKGVAPFQYARKESDSLWRKGNAAGIAYNKYHYGKEAPDERTASGIGRINYYENFKDFMAQRKDGEPFYFWYGSTEPHRGFEKDSWIRNHKKLSDASVPGFLPDSALIQGDLLDYAVEIEWADNHLCKMLDYLDSIGELDNTMVIVTADNGMGFPSAKALCIEYGTHVPLAISYPKEFPANRKVDDPVSFTDLAPTILEMAGVSSEGMLPITGKSIVNTLKSEKSGIVDPEKKYVFSGRERHSSSRWNNLGYPQRAVRSSGYLLVWNMKPERWPAGAPQAIDKKTGKISPMYGLDASGKHHPEWAFNDVDIAPSKSYLVENYKNKDIRPYFDLAFSKRPEFELYDIRKDPACTRNLYGQKEFQQVGQELFQTLETQLKETGDPRVIGPDKEIFDSYKRYIHIREFPEPDWYKK